MTSDTFTGLFSYFPTDWIVIFAFAALLALDALRSGYGRAISAALSLPVTFLLSNMLPGTAVLSGISSALSTQALKALVFAVIFVGVYILVRKMRATYRSGGGEVVQSILAGVAATVVLVVIWLQVPELQSVWNFGPQVQAVFGEVWRFWWLASSYSVLAFVRG